MRALLRHTLEEDGFVVVEASDGAELLQLMAAQGGNEVVVVTDVRMPSFSGLGVLRVLRQAEWMGPVILITVDPTPAVVSDAAQWGAVLFCKPFDIDDLRTAVANAAHLRWSNTARGK